MIKTRCIALHRFAYSDSSVIVKALTEECGIVSFIIKGGKKLDSPFKGALDSLTLSEVVFRQNPATDLQFLKEAVILNYRSCLRGDLLKNAMAQVMAEIVMRYAPQGVTLTDEFLLLNDALEHLDKKDSSEFIFAKWLLDTCEMWGYHLDLNVCSRCENNLVESAADFYPESGGLICKKCLGIAIPRAKSDTLKGLWILNNYIQKKENQPFLGREFAENALLFYLKKHTGFLKEIHSLSWLQEVRKLCLTP